MAFPKELENTGLYKKLEGDTALFSQVESLRSIVEILAKQISFHLPELTDHSITHLDALWRVTDVVLTPEEIESLSVSEAFLLACSLYTHDLGMAILCTEDGASQLRESTNYKQWQTRLESEGIGSDVAARISLKTAARELHAKLAPALLTQKIPGLDRYLIESSEIRNAWCENIGQIAASHHWPLTEVASSLGSRGSLPSPKAGETIDLAHVACLLRIIDFAHINFERASSIERMVRPNLPVSSLVHWLAQEPIAGPARNGTEISYGSTQPIADVDAWWLFYEMVRGLNQEIVDVAEYLENRNKAKNRFSLTGVKNTGTPHAFKASVQTRDFEPIDIRFRPDSMERLITLLGGESLYGSDYFAPIRELLQNARDAVCLRQSHLAKQGVDFEAPSIKINLYQKSDAWYLAVQDNGIGMSEHVLTNYLLGIASDYWNSTEFYSEHSIPVQQGFKPVGRFGIGFLSVFMIGDEVEVSTQKSGGQSLLLSLKGIGRRGTLTKRPPAFTHGTTVVVRLKAGVADTLEDLPGIVMSKAPMLEFPLTIRTPQTPDGIVISSGWWKTESQRTLLSFIGKTGAEPGMSSLIRRRKGIHVEVPQNSPLDELDENHKWPGDQPELLDPTSRLIASPRMDHIVVCSKGFAVRMIQGSGLAGLVDIDDIRLDASRSELLNWDAQQFITKSKAQIKPKILKAVDGLISEHDIPARFEFLLRAASTFDRELLKETTLPWITERIRPGNSALISPSDLVAKVKAKKQVLITYGVSIWRAESLARESFRDASNEAIVIPISQSSQPQVGKYDEKAPIYAPLKDHFEPRDYDYGGNSYPRAHFLRSVVELIREALELPADSEYEKWVRLGRENELLGYIAIP